MAGPGWTRPAITARSSRQITQFSQVGNADRVFGNDRPGKHIVQKARGASQAGRRLRPSRNDLLTLASGRTALLLSALRRRRALHLLLSDHDAVVGSSGVLRPAIGIGAGREADRRNRNDRVNQMFHLVLPDCRNPGAGKLGRNGRLNQGGARKNGSAIGAGPAAIRV